MKADVGTAGIVALLAFSVGAGRAQEASTPQDEPAAAAAAPQPYEQTIPVASPEPDAAIGESEPESAVRLDEIVVTATKRAQGVRDIPASVTALSGEELERQGVQGIDQIVQRVPGVNLTDDGLGQSKRVTIRGVSADANVNFTAGLLFGDVPFSDPFIPKVQLDPNTFDMATVEVLKGPQGTLFGGSGLNGVIRYVPELPQFDATEFKYFVQHLDYTEDGAAGLSYGGVANVPFWDGLLAGRVMAFRREIPGYVDDTQAGKKNINSGEQHGWRAMLGALPAPGWKLNLLAMAQHSESADVAFTDNFNGDLARGTTPRPSPATTDYRLGSLGVEYAFSWADFLSQTSAFDKRWDAFIDGSRTVPPGTVPNLGVGAYNESEAFVQEFRLVSPEGDGEWKWLVGLVHYQIEVFDCAELAVTTVSLPPIPIPGLSAAPCPQNAAKIPGPIIGQLIGDIELRDQAAFGEVGWAPVEALEFTLGARVYRTRSEGTVQTDGVLYSPQTGGQRQRRGAVIEEDGVSPKLSLSWRPTEGVMSYVTASKGFRFGGIQLGASTPNTEVPPFFKSDSLWNYELGLRTEWFDRTLFADLTAYAIDWENPQVHQASNDGLSSFIDNVGGVEGRGVESALRWLVPGLEGLSLSASAAYGDLKTTEDFESAANVVVPAGSPWPLSPQWQTSATLAYVLPLQSWKLAPSVRYSSLSEACNVIECTAQVFGYETIDVNLMLANYRLDWLPELSASLTNLTNERGISNVTINPALGTSINYIAPRALMLRLSGKF